MDHFHVLILTKKACRNLESNFQSRPGLIAAIQVRTSTGKVREWPTETCRTWKTQRTEKDWINFEKEVSKSWLGLQPPLPAVDK